MDQNEAQNDTPAATEAKGEKVLTPEAKRALAEADARRKQQAKGAQPKEVGGPKGPEPTRYGDWEKGGVAHDF